MGNVLIVIGVLCCVFGAIGVLVAAFRKMTKTSTGGKGGRSFMVVVVGVILAFVGGAMAQPDDNQAVTPQDSASAQVTAASDQSQQQDQAAPAPQPVAAPAYTVPAQEQDVVNIVQQYVQSYDNAANDMVKGSIHRQRGIALCKALGRSHVVNWIGKISTLDSDSRGNGVLAIEVSNRITLLTNNNDMSEDMNKIGSQGGTTMIPAGSPLFQAVSAMQVGEMVKFSGDFFTSSDDCVEEMSLTTDGGMDNPEFLFRFTGVQAAGG
jgi:hypothetical protein